LSLAWAPLRSRRTSSLPAALRLLSFFSLRLGAKPTPTFHAKSQRTERRKTRSEESRSPNELRGEPAERNQDCKMNPVITARRIPTKMITDHQEDDRHSHESVLL